VIYSIITSAKNEQQYICKTIESVINQTILPNEWIIMDDHSSDSTFKIVEAYSIKYPWIKLLESNNVEIPIKATGGRIATLFNHAITRINPESQYIVKLDADVSFETNFFEMLFLEFSFNDKLGIASGTLVSKGIPEKLDYNIPQIRGAVMVIKRSILEKTNGLFVAKCNGEDTLLAVAARYFGWATLSFPIYFNHLKLEGSKNTQIFNNWITGFYKGAIPYTFIYFLATQFKHLFKKPFLLGSVLQILGYIYTRFILKYAPFPSYVRFQLNKEQKMKIKNTLWGRSN
jgi:poly-beta-1,6-N-acetyl-D-glucosamine synthase